MKNYLIFSIVAIISIFGFGIGSAKAETIIDLNYNDPILINGIETMNNKYNNIFEQLVTIAKQYESQGFIFVIRFNPWKTTLGSLDCFVYKFSNYKSLSYSGTGSGINFSGSNYEGYNFSITIHGEHKVSDMENKLQQLTNALNDYENLFSPYSGNVFSVGASFKNTNNKIDFSWNYGSSYSSIMYYITENEEYPFAYNPYFDGKYTLDGQTIENGSPYPSYYNYRVNIYSSSTFDEIVSSIQYSQVEFTFELPTSSKECTRNEMVDGVLKPIKYECPLLDLNYDIRTTDSEGNYEDMNLTFGIPYLYYRHLEDTGSSSITKTDTIPLGEFINNRYTGNYAIEPTTNGLSLKLIVPLDYLNATYVRVYFESNLKFSVKYIDNENDYMETVDFTGKYAVTFKPKQINEDMLLGFGFGIEGLYAIQLRDSYYSDYNVLKYYTIGYCDGGELNSSISTTCSNNSYLVYFDYKKGNIEQVVTVVNKNYGNEKNIKATVTYDTRYFSYVIHDTPSSRPVMKDPITGNDITLGDLTNFDVYLFKDKNDSFFQMFTNAFSSFKNVIVEIFQNLTYFYNSLPIVLQNFFIVIFTFVLFMFLIRFIL